MKRRTLVNAGAITVFGAALPFSGARAQNRYAKYAGKTVVMNVPAHPHYDAMTKLLPEFTKETGIKVELDKLAIGRLKEKQLLEMAKPQGDYDLACYIVMWKTEYVSKNLVQPLEPVFDESWQFVGELATDSRSNLLPSIGVDRVVEDSTGAARGSSSAM